MIAFEKVFQVCFVYFMCLIVSTHAEKYRICVVDGKENYKDSAKYCPKLDEQDSPVECVVALDRLDCLRRIHKGKADFGVFTAEDLVAASNSDIELLITNELRFVPDQTFEYEIVAVISNHAGIKSKHDLKGKKYCHPGYGYEADWTKILSNYFEALVVTPQCDPQLTIVENRVKASSKFFGAACKAGPWTNDAVLDFQLKRKYSNLCILCYDPKKCSQQDKYWGRTGSLLCLTDGAGDVSWARLEDVKHHFGITPGGQEGNPEEYSLLCPDDSIMPLNSSSPCIWVVKPWSVVASRMSKTSGVQSLINSLDRSILDTNTSSWKFNLLNLIEPIYLTAEMVNPIISIETYFRRAKGFLNANSFSACHPPRTIRICTTSNIETAKCSWLRESAAVYGIEPDLDCLKADNKTHCMMALNDKAADIMVVPPDLVSTATRNYALKTLFYETTLEPSKYIVVVVTKKETKLEILEDLRGIKACFPSYDGIAWHSVASTLQRNHLIGCAIDRDMATFFGPSCVPDSPGNLSENLRKGCQSDFQGENGALHCLASGVGDVAFVSSKSIKKFAEDLTNDFDYPDIRNEVQSFQINCLEKNQPCYLSWSPPGQAMIRASRSDVWIKDTLNVFLNLDGLFGKHFRDPTNAFTMFGRYDGASNVLFHDETEKLREVPTVKNIDVTDLFFENVLGREKVCYAPSSSNRIMFVKEWFIAILGICYWYINL
ncbi:transferrin [Euwallacea fornicatus]|uniref:transferrin n=1 Tax=Euwallacea fornicatus TaxID=995702 RepID=UPI00338DFA34